MQRAEKKTYRYLALGDSYTIGEKVMPAENFPNQVVAILEKKELNFEVKIIAQTGWTTDELQAGIKKAELTQPYDFVTLLIGVNDQYRERKVSDYTPLFESLLQQAIQFTGHKPSHVIVLSIPDWGVTPFAEGRDRLKIAAEIDAYNAVNKLIAEKYNVHYMDITPGTRNAAIDITLLTSDGLHPSGKEYAKWAKQLAAVIESEL